MAVKTKTPTSTTSTAPRIPAPASQAARTSGTRSPTSATSSRLAVSPRAVSTSQQRRSAAQTPAPVPSAQKQKQKTPITLPPGLNAQEKKDAGLIGRVLDTAPKFAELVANRTASGQLSSKQLNDLAYIAKQGQVHGRTDQQVRASLEKAMNGMQPSVQKAFLQEFGRAMVQDTWGNLKKFNDGIDAAGRETVIGLATAAIHPGATFRNAQTAAVNGVAKGREELQLVGQATGLRPGNAQAARNQLGQQANAAGRYVRGIASDPGKIGATTFNALSLAFPTSGGRAALAAAGREAAAVGERAVGAVGRSSMGQTATQAISTAKTKGNQVLDTVAQSMFGGGGPPGTRPALMPASGVTTPIRHQPTRVAARPRSTETVESSVNAMAKAGKGAGQAVGGVKAVAPRATFNPQELQTLKPNQAKKSLLTGTNNVRVASRDEAESIFQQLFGGQGYRNTTGLNGRETRQALGTKEMSYHWDYGDVEHGGMPHIQVHTPDGIIKVWFEEGAGIAIGSIERKAWETANPGLKSPAQKYGSKK